MFVVWPSVLECVVSVLTQRVKVLCVQTQLNNQPISAGIITALNGRDAVLQEPALQWETLSWGILVNIWRHTHTHTHTLTHRSSPDDDISTVTQQMHWWCSQTDVIVTDANRRYCTHRGHGVTSGRYCTADSVHNSTSYTSYLISIYFVFISLMLRHWTCAVM